MDLKKQLFGYSVPNLLLKGIFRYTSDTFSRPRAGQAPKRVQLDPHEGPENHSKIDLGRVLGHKSAARASKSPPRRQDEPKMTLK